jgi:hypothetical protein
VTWKKSTSTSLSTILELALVMYSIKPYRLIYRVHSKQVIIYVITDGRRDMGSLLSRRLLGA